MLVKDSAPEVQSQSTTTTLRQKWGAIRCDDAVKQGFRQMLVTNTELGSLSLQA